MTKIKEVFKGYLKGVHRCKDHSKVKLYRIVKSNKGEVNLFAIVCLATLGFMLIVLLIMF